MDEYLHLALSLSRDLDRLNGLRREMRSRIESSPPRDEAGFTRGIEQAYRAMWKEWCENHG
jgi:protein O-GlcNAc transferase